jgi:hypothetical protein
MYGKPSTRLQAFFELITHTHQFIAKIFHLHPIFSYTLKVPSIFTYTQFRVGDFQKPLCSLLFSPLVTNNLLHRTDHYHVFVHMLRKQYSNWHCFNNDNTAKAISILGYSLKYYYVFIFT